MPPPTPVADAAPSGQVTITTTPARVKVPTILQQAQVECGAASLGMILAHFGKWESLDSLRTACGVSRDGASAVAIVGAAAGFGVVVHAVAIWEQAKAIRDDLQLRAK